MWVVCCAATSGLGTNDDWNNMRAAPATAAALPNLIYADGIVSGSGLTVLNAPGDWGYSGSTRYSHYTTIRAEISRLLVTNLQTASV